MKSLTLTELERNAQIGYHLKRLRAERGLSQADLAKAVGVSQSLLALIEAGARTLTVPLCADLAEALQCDIHELVKLTKA